MGFECFQCGGCCTQMGLVYRVKEEYGNFSFLLGNNYTMVDAPVTVDPDKHDLFNDKNIFTKFPDACPFFRHRPGTGLAYCTVHGTRPEICQDYQCWRILILNPRGHPVGKIKYLRTLVSDDPILLRIWEDCIEQIRESDENRWETMMIGILSRSGYGIRK